MFSLNNSIKVLFFISLNTVLFAYSPNDLTGYKVALTITNSSDVSQGEETHTFYFKSNTSALEKSGDNGQWYPDTTSWTVKSSRIANLIIGVTTDEYADVTMTFQNSNFGTFTFDYYDSDNNGPLEKVDAGSGTFSLNSYSSSEIPYDYYFTDDFSDSSKSQNLWPVISNDGITNSIKNGTFLVSGSISDGDDRWHDVNANTILSLSKDWVISGSSFTKIPYQDSLNYQAAVGLDAEVGQHDVEGFEFEISIGISPWGIMSEVYVSDIGTYASQYQSSSRQIVSEGTFRVFNSPTDKTLTSQYKENDRWITIYQLNWETGLLTEKNTGSGSDQTHQFNNWGEDLTNAFVAPMMDFTIPHLYKENDAFENITFEEGDLGFSNFTVSGDAPEPDPDYAPSSLVGMIYKGSMNDTYQFIDETNAIFYHQESNFQSSEVSNITYTWNSNGDDGTLTTSLDETTTLSFSSASEGTFQWQEDVGSTSSGSFTLDDASAGYAPLSLAGDSMIAGTTTYIFKENGIVTIRSATSSQDSTYGFVKSGNDEIVFNIPAHSEDTNSTFYKMTFSSTDSGSLSEGASGSFQYFIDGDNLPPTKGWMWFDKYPWVYSNIEGGWLYFNPSGSKLMVYSFKDKAWRNMTE